MIKPALNPVDTQFEALLQDLPLELIDSARQFQAFTRARKIKTPQELLRVVLLYCGLDQSLRTVAGNLTLLDERITDSSVMTRLKACEPWVKALLPQLLPPLPLLPLLPAGSRLSVIDGSSIEAPGADGTDYRLHLRLDLVSLTFLELVVTDVHTAESLRHFSLSAGDIALVDRGYCQPAALVETHQQGADWIVRWNSGMPLGTPTGEEFDWVATLKQVPPTQVIVTQAVQVGPVGSSARVVATLHACRLPEAQANAARRRCRRQAQKKGKTLKAATLYLAGWVIVVTTLDPAVWTAEIILALYRVRWQVELAIKRWKSLLDVGRLRAKAEGTLASLWLHGKLLYALLLERRCRRLAGDQWGYLDQSRQATWWRSWHLMTHWMVTAISGVTSWKESQWSACIEVMKERRRQRQLQTLPAAVQQLVLLAGGAANVPSSVLLAA
jgi:hypothetical protein